MTSIIASALIEKNFDKIISCVKELVKVVDERTDDILNAMVAFNSESTSAPCEVSEPSDAADQIVTAVKGACVFVDSIHDLLYYGRKTEFESIKVDIRNGSSIKLNWFIHKMNEWLNNTKHAYEDFTSKCSAASKYFTDGAEKLERLQAQENESKNKARIVGGAVSVTIFSGSIGSGLGTVAIAASTVAGSLTLGVGAIVGIGVTAAVGLGWVHLA